MRPAVYLIGGGPLASRVPGWAREAGLAVVCTDRDPEAPGLAAADERLVADGAATEEHVAFARSLRGRCRVVGVLCGGDFGLETVRRVSEALDLAANDRAAVARSRDKAAMKAALREAGVPTPGGGLARGPDELRGLVGDGGRWVIKPTAGSGSRGVEIVGADSDLGAAFSRSLAAVGNEGAVVVEPFLRGPSIDANGVLDGERLHPCGILAKFATPLPSRLPLAGLDPVPLSGDEEREVYGLLERGARAIGLTVGPVKGDLIRTEGGWVLLEVAPRFHGDVTTANTLPFGSGVNALRFLFRLWADGRVDPSELGACPERTGFATWRVICLPPGAWERAPDPPADGEHPLVTRVWHNPRVARRIPRYGDTTAVPGYVCARGRDRGEAEEALARWFASAGYRVRPSEADAGWYARLGEALDAAGFDRAASGYVASSYLHGGST